MIPKKYISFPLWLITARFARFFYHKFRFYRPLMPPLCTPINNEYSMILCYFRNCASFKICSYMLYLIKYTPVFDSLECQKSVDGYQWDLDLWEQCVCWKADEIINLSLLQEFFCYVLLLLCHIVHRSRIHYRIRCQRP